MFKRSGISLNSAIAGLESPQSEGVTPFNQNSRTNVKQPFVSSLIPYRDHISRISDHWLRDALAPLLNRETEVILWQSI